MLILNKTKKELKDQLGTFAWDFKIVDNIQYNLDILFQLVIDHNTSPLGEWNIPIRDFKKPISLLSISIIEAIMVDFLYRLYEGTVHFPVNLRTKEDEIKNRLGIETKKSKYIDLEDREHWIARLKNFNFISMIDIYDELRLLGEIQKNYESLKTMAHYRNRIHMKNYFNNFEKDESRTFSKERTQKSLHAMEWFFSYFERTYPRPWKTKNG